jgi:hypothetical protein
MLMRGVEKTFVQKKTTKSANVGDIDLRAPVSSSLYIIEILAIDH